MRIVGTKLAFKGFLTIHKAEIETEDGARFTREIEDHGSAAAVLPYDPVRRVALLVRQLRAPALWLGGVGDLAEAPAGITEGEEPAETIRREAMEEAGLRLGGLEFVGAPFGMPGISTERIHLYLAIYGAADRIGTGGGVAGENEHITVEEIPLADLWAQVEAGAIADLKTLALAMALKLRRPELF
jgi:nudix-type nucleoside diphosphatase (YffH/AdpP family)